MDIIKPALGLIEYGLDIPGDLVANIFYGTLADQAAHLGL
jgi:hypothetical protein